MGQGIERLSALAISRKLKPGYYGDGGGLYLQVGKHGSKSWVFRFRVRKPASDAGRLREMGLGAVSSLTLAEAREAARNCRKQILDGQDPIEMRVLERAVRASQQALEAATSKTFDECAKAYIAAHEAGWKNRKHAAQWNATLKAYVSPIIGSLPVSQIDVTLVMRVLDPIWVSKKETAKRVRGRMESVLAWAAVRGYRYGENPARWKGCIDQLVPSHARLGQRGHHSALPYEEMSSFMARLKKQPGIAAAALEFTILTAARTGEVLGAVWDEINLDTRIWSIPAHRMKAGRVHKVPLSLPAVAILKVMEKLRNGDAVFPSAREGKHLSNMAMLSVLKRMGRADLTAHGFRSTFRDWAAEKTDFQSEVAEMALAHSISRAVEAAYRRGDLFEKRRLLMRDWGSFCEAPAAVVRIQTKG